MPQVMPHPLARIVDRTVSVASGSIGDVTLVLLYLVVLILVAVVLFGLASLASYERVRPEGIVPGPRSSKIR